jgi:Tfp pilus assembly protein PilF
VLWGRAQPARRAPALTLLAGLFVLPFLAQGANTVVRLVGATPLSPHDCLEEAELTVAEEGDDGRARAVALVHHAIDWAPVDSDAHRAYAEAVGDTPEGEAALRRAVSLDPWSATLRDDLAIRLLDEGNRDAGSAELEESMRRFPYLASHGYLSPELDPSQQDAKRLIRALAEGDTMTIRLASLDADMAEAIDRGLVQAQADAAEGDERAAVVNDRVTLLEARERWGEAAALLEAEAGNSASAGTALARAAQNYLKAREYAAAEQSLLAAVVRMPDAGDLYRDLAVDVYAARGDYEMAENVLDAGQRNAVDMLPVYDGVTEVLQRRESARSDDLVGPAAPRQLEAELIP